jgi:hypothetical protein
MSLEYEPASQYADRPQLDAEVDPELGAIVGNAKFVGM